MEVTDIKLLKIYQAEILNRSSKIICDASKRTYYVKHLDIFLSSVADEAFHEAFIYCKLKGLPNKKEKLDELDKSGEWTKKNDQDLNEQKEFLSRLRATKSKLYLKADIERTKHQIYQAELKISETVEKRDNLIGLHAESYANRKANLVLLKNSLFKDPSCVDMAFGDEEFEDLENSELSVLFDLLNRCLSRFENNNIRRISLLPSFLNGFFLCDNDPFVFYGIPISKLTFYQSEVFSSAKYFKQMMEETNNGLPENLMSDPDKLTEWFERNKNAKRVLEKNEGKDNMSMSLVGATPEDLEDLGLYTSGRRVNLAEEAKKKGGALTMHDLINLQGI